MESAKVYTAITACTAALAKGGISKDRKNQQQGYSFRGIDDIYNALAGVLAANALCIIPRVLSRDVVERTTQKGGVLFYVTVEVEFDVVCATDGSRHTAKVYGEAMDSADKATNKAMSAAYKYMALQLFCIPTEGDNDADGTTHAVTPARSPVPSDALIAVLTAIGKAQTMADLDAVKPLLRDLNNDEKGHAVQAGINRRNQLTDLITTNP